MTTKDSVFNKPAVLKGQFVALNQRYQSGCEMRNELNSYVDKGHMPCYGMPHMCFKDTLSAEMSWKKISQSVLGTIEKTGETSEVKNILKSVNNANSLQNKFY